MEKIFAFGVRTGGWGGGGGVGAVVLRKSKGKSEHRKTGEGTSTLSK